MNQASLALPVGYEVPGTERITYPAGFWQWMATDEGRAIWSAFERKALQMAVVRKRYSAMAIAQVIRWDSDLADPQHLSAFKLNNNNVPGLARYWMRVHGKRHPGFFQLRDSLGRDET